MGLNTAVTSFDNAVTPEVSTLSYEQARDELVQVVARLEAGGQAYVNAGDGARARLDAARAQDVSADTPDETTGDDR
ncbi:exodeoxyribonuclease VII small subunit [Cellulosimicrobium cellulans J34]|nr:exodeoxyribonuclease VII small subunit [Cellulosimicrobium cellulans J34]